MRLLKLGFVVALCSGCARTDKGSQGPGPDLEANTGGAAGTTSQAGGAGSAPSAGGAGSTTSAGGASSTTSTTTQSEKLNGPWNSLAPADRATQQAQLSTLQGMTTDELVARGASALNEELGYAPEAAKWLELIQASSLSLNERELTAFKKNGFVISDRQSYPNFFYGYKTIYAADLPVYVSADSILFALHRSYDKILMDLESSSLRPTLLSLLRALRPNITSAAISEDSKHDLGLLLGVAQGLLDTNATGIDAEMKAFIDKATAGSGMEDITLFGAKRNIDFSQFTPRGHYADGSMLASYFRCMIWLGRTELRLVDVDQYGARTLSRREIEDVLALDELFTDKLRTDWQSIDKVIELFVGVPDYMTLPQAQQLRSALGISASTELATVSDSALLATIDAGNYGLQNISSQIMVMDAGMTTLPSSFALFGQRYTVDSQVFSKVVYPNMGNSPSAPYRMMPNPLDVAFAALGNDQALPLLRSELDRYTYAPNLANARQLVEWHGAEYWDSSLYTLWVSALRELSEGSYDTTNLPGIASTNAWGRRLLNTQLGSWAELRHDTLLYAKQSYTGVPSCEYPDGYVDPYPGVFARLQVLANLAAERLSTVLPSAQTSAVTYFRNFAEVASRLETMATEELTGAPRTPEDLAFLNDVVATKSQDAVCTTITVPSGWYTKLFYDRDDAFDSDPTIADVHTQPADESGATVGRVLHVATGNPRLMITTVDSCDGPRAYAGVVSAYFEQITEDFKRKTDQEWANALKTATPPDVSWMQDLVVR